MDQYNETFSHEKLVVQKPFGWTVPDPPVITPYKFESSLDFYYWVKYAEDNKSLVFIIGGIYVFTIFALQKWMSTRPAYHLKMPLFYWNLSLGIFSIVCFLRSAPAFFYTLQQPGGLFSSICLKENMDIPSFFWAGMFMVSKFVELGDTIFIVLRKRPLVLLQWYHHFITMTVAWVAGPLWEPLVRWIIVLNTFVHSFMYPYFALRAINVKVPLVVANFITTAQLLQMFIGFAVNISSVYFLHAGYDCARYSLSVKTFFVVYCTFILLFGKLFYTSVWKQGHKKKLS